MDFRLISVDDKTFFEKQARENGYGGTETCFANMFCWGVNSGFFISEKDDFLYLRGKDKKTKTFFYFPHLGGGDYRKAIENIIDDAAENGVGFNIVSITESTKKRIEATGFEFRFFENRNGFDYIYEREALANLSGKKYHSKKNFVNRFKKLYPDYQVEVISEKNMSECIEINEIWCGENRLGTGNSCGDSCAIKTAFSNYDKLELFGILLRVRGRAVSFTVGSRLNDNTFITHFEKALSDYPGAYQTVNMEFALRLSEYTYINREEDMGDEGLRKAKLSYHPDLLVKYNAKL